MKKLLFILFVSICCMNAVAQLKLPSVIDDNMILQQNKANTIWGWAAVGEKVNIQFMNRNYHATADKKGEWKIVLSPEKAGPSGDMIITSGKDNRTIKNILFGEVWLCSGQSNMEFTMSGFMDLYKSEISNSKDKDLRFVVVKNSFGNKEARDVLLKNKWSSVDSVSILNCSAVAYFFAKKLRERLRVPVGLVVSSWSGTPAQSWVDTATLKEFSYYNKLYNKSVKPIDFSSIDSLKKEAENLYRKKVRETAGSFNKMTAIEYDTTGWEKASLPGIWETLGHPDLDGIAAYRISFTIPAGEENRSAFLHLPAIDDIDSTYINGVFIGSHNVWNQLRVYNVPANILRPGKNIITIWVEDGGGGGGLNMDTENYYLQLGEKQIALKGDAAFKILLSMDSIGAGINFASLQNYPSVLFNAMIAPLLPVNMAGVIWYQGESNASVYKEYRKLFPALINNWRTRFKQKDLPFLFVQLSSYNPDIIEPAESDWAGLREAQTETLKLPNTGMAVTIDVGDQKDIHPKRKKEVGYRLAANALNISYGYKNEVPAGPLYRSSKRMGSSIKISFNNIGKGLEVKGQTLMGFTIAGADKKFVEATAVLKGNEVIVSSPAVNSPMYVRYAWANAPMDANLYNKDGFPASPFRTSK